MAILNVTLMFKGFSTHRQSAALQQW